MNRRCESKSRLRPVIWFRLRPVIALMLAVASLPTPLDATEVNAIHTSQNGDTFRLHSDISLGASLAHVREVLSRYDSIPRLDPDITEVTMLGANANGSMRMSLATSQCLAFICMRYRWTQDVRTLDSGEILAEIVPGHGDINTGWMRYRAVRDGSHTRLIVDAEIDTSGVALPAGLIAPWIQGRLEDEALETAHLVERAADAAAMIFHNRGSISRSM